MFAAGMVALALGQGVIEVEDGKITKCRHCGKEIENTVRKLNVAPEDTGKYRVVYDVGSCAACAKSETKSGVRHICLKCKSEYMADARADRSSGRVIADKTLCDDFCPKCAGEFVDEMDIAICARCGKEMKLQCRGPRGHIHDYKNIAGKVEYKEDCVLLHSVEGDITIEYRLDSREPPKTATIRGGDLHCRSCDNLMKREATAKKIGDAIGGFGRAFGEGVLQGVKRNE